VGGRGKQAQGIPFGRYLLRERLARGGMGEVFRAVAVGAGGFEKPVVVKRVLPELVSTQRLAAMFVEEAKLMSRLAHPNIVQVIDFGQGEADDYFLVLELVDGVDLGRLRRCFARRKEWMPVPLALHVVEQMLRGLGHAHDTAAEQGRVLVHRDVSPSNVLLSRVGEVKIADFGVAFVGPEGGPSTVTDSLVGKPAYMAPEQQARAPIDGRADLFSVGVVLYELLTNELPFGSRDDEQRRAAIAAGKYPPVSTTRAGLADGSDELERRVDALVAKALADEPEERFASAKAMLEAVEELRAAGQLVASSDELAQAVREQIGQAPASSKPVIALGAGSSPPAAEPLRELTRTAASELFTIRFSSAPGSEAPPAEGAQAPDREGDQASSDDSVDLAVAGVRPRRWPLFAVGAALIVGAGAWWLRADPPPTELEQRGATAAPPAEAGAHSVDAATAVEIPLNSSPSSSTDAHAPTSSASSPPRTGPSATALAWTAATTSTATASLTSAPSTASASACMGSLHLYAAHGWLVSGGPTVVQAPGRYRWPCGAYSLRATSRVDAGVSRSHAVVVREGATSLVDLR